jgi:hypothetical protein
MLLFREVIAVYFAIYTKNINALWAKFRMQDKTVA